MMLSLSDVCLWRTSGITREQRGLGRPKLAHGYPTSGDSDTTFNVRRSKINLQGRVRGNIVTDSRTLLVFINSLIFMAPTAIGSKARWALQA